MRFLFIAILFVLTTRSWGQFDRVNSDPLSLNASFAGSSGGVRIGNVASYSSNMFSYYEKYYNKISIDAFIPELKGGIAFSMTGMSLDFPELYYLIYDNNYKEDLWLWNSEVVYSPKLTFKNSITWSPSIRFGFVRHSTTINYQIPDLNKNLLYISLGLMRNSQKSFYGLEYFEGLNQQIPGYTRKVNFQMGVKFDKNAKNSWSSTLTFGLHKEFVKNDKDKTKYNPLGIDLEYILRWKSVIFLVTKRDLGIGIKRPVWGMEFRIQHIDYIFTGFPLDYPWPDYRTIGPMEDSYHHVLKFGFSYQFN